MDRTSQRAHSCAHEDICLELPACPENYPGTSGLCLILKSECPATFGSAPAQALQRWLYTLLLLFVSLAYWPLPLPPRGSLFHFLVQDGVFPGAQISPGLPDNTDLITRRLQRNQPRAQRCHIVLLGHQCLLIVNLCHRLGAYLHYSEIPETFLPLFTVTLT